MNLTLLFEGGQELAAALESLTTSVSRKVQREALMTAAEPMRKRMSQLAPHAPGAPDLRDTMAIGTNAKGEDGFETAIAVGPTRAGYYGSFQEFGTSRHAAQPFARPAFDEMALRSLALIGAAFWTELASKGVYRSAASLGGVVGGPGGSTL